MIENEAMELIKAAIEKDVSDIHLLPEKNGYHIYFRFQGQMNYYQEASLDWGKRLISYFKFLANLDVGEKRKPQSGAIHYRMKELKVELRLSTITNIDLIESLVIRVIQQTIKEGQQLLAFYPQKMDLLRKLVARKSGLILFSGPVGSGKTTTIYQLLRERISNEMLQIITMEDPVEIIEERFLQTEVNLKAGITYDQLIKASLRHHPDILVIGEIRDEETAKMVIRGALTGHLIIATIHAKNALGVIGRLQELGISNQQISQTLIGVVSQRLIPLSIKENHLHRRRAVLFELLEGEALNNAIVHVNTTYLNINQQLRKAWACGYITTKDYQKFEVI